MSVPAAAMGAALARPPGLTPPPQGGMKPSPGIAGAGPAPGAYPGPQRPAPEPNVPGYRPIMPVGGGAPMAPATAPQMRLANALRGGFR